MKKIIYTFLIISLLVIFSSCMTNYSESYKAELEIYLSEYLAGPAVENVDVTIFDSENNQIFEGTTNEKGYIKALLEWDVSNGEEEEINIKYKKEGFASSEVKTKKLTGKKSKYLDNGEINSSINKAKLFENDEFPETSVKFVDKDGRMIDIENIEEDVIYAEIESSEQITVAYFGLDFMPWAATNNGMETNFGPGEKATIPISIPHSASGEQELNFVIYDVNRSRLHQYYYINVNKTTEEPETMAKPENPWLYSITRNYEARLYSMPEDILEKTENYKQVENQEVILEDINSLESDNYEIPERGNLYIRIYWNEPEDKTGIIGYHIYKSTDGENFEKIAFTENTSTADNGFDLEPGKEVSYKIKSVYEGGYESESTEVVSVTPLNLFKVNQINPRDNSYSVKRKPELRWKPVSLDGGDTNTGAGVINEEEINYYYTPIITDFAQSTGSIWVFQGEGEVRGVFEYSSQGPQLIATEFMSSYWQGNNIDWVMRKDGKLYPYSYLFDALEAGKTYQWGLTSAYAEYVQEESTAVAVIADIFSGNADLIVPNPSVPYNTFTTGQDY
ncbi:MAG: hypothetical protein ACQESN_09270 [Thermotogota bacterium]